MRMVPSADTYDNIERRPPDLERDKLGDVVLLARLRIVRLGECRQPARVLLLLETAKTVNQIGDAIAWDCANVEPARRVGRVAGKESNHPIHRPTPVFG